MCRALTRGRGSSHQLVVGLTAKIDTGLSDVMVICRESKGLRKGVVIVDWPIAISFDT